MPSHLEVPCLGRVVAAKNTAQFLPASTTTTSTSQHAPQGQEKKCRREGRAVFTAPPPAPRACDAHRGSASGRACPREMDAERKTRRKRGDSLLTLPSPRTLSSFSRTVLMPSRTRYWSSGASGFENTTTRHRKTGRKRTIGAKRMEKWSLFSLII